MAQSGAAFAIAIGFPVGAVCASMPVGMKAGIAR